MDEKGLQKIQDQHRSCLTSNHQKAKTLLQQKVDYEALSKRLEHITDKSYHNVMIPIGGSKAFFEGQIEHTNEIMVLLGDNWFVERSAKEAREICQRRIDRCQLMLDDLDKESKLYQSWLQEESKFSSDGTQEIIEEYDEEREIEWRIAHRERVKAEKINRDQQDFVDEDNSDLWQRLDELELEEELDAHLEKQKGLSNNGNNIELDEDWRESKSPKKSILKKSKYCEDNQARINQAPQPPKKVMTFASNDTVSGVVIEHNPESKDEAMADEKPSKTEKITQYEDLSEGVLDLDPESGGSKSGESDEDWSESPALSSDSSDSEDPPSESMNPGKTKRSVSFGIVSQRLFSHQQDAGQMSQDIKKEATKIIEFEHESTPKSVQVGSSDHRPNHPGELVEIFSQRFIQRPEPKSPKKSILKKSKYGGDGLAKIDPTPQPPQKGMTFATSNAVSEVVIERNPDFKEKPVAVEKPSKTQKISRFRATRIHQ